MYWLPENIVQNRKSRKRKSHTIHNICA